MSRRKGMLKAVWKGDTIDVGQDLIMVLELKDEPDRAILLEITPTLAKRLEHKLVKSLTHY